MSDIVIKVENLSKQYRLGGIGSGSLKDDLKKFWYRAQGKENPFLKVGDENDRSKPSLNDYVWALRDINFEIKRGDVVGIIGKNGAGKSTLLKILSRTTGPTSGSVKIKGRIASLLEVGTGFHPELSGRENIYLNGAILGLRKQEISRKLEEIISFAGVERYIDTPVKRYSSGMYVRLAFAVAAHLEPDILILDEVLAVGDSEFQRKSLGKIKEVSQNEGRTVILVSHNLGSIKNLCRNALLLEKGRIAITGATHEVLDYYLKDASKNMRFSFDLAGIKRTRGMGNILKISKIIFNDNTPIRFGYPLNVKIYFESFSDFEDLCVGIGINTTEETRILTLDSDSDPTCHERLMINAGPYVLSLIVADFRLAPGLYTFDAAIRNGQGSESILDLIQKQEYLQVEPSDKASDHLFDGMTGGYRPIPAIKVLTS